MFRLLYVSNTDRYTNPRDIAEILRVSRINNAKLGVTGILLHLDGSFMQVLEGGKETVLTLYSKIRENSRHWNVQILLTREGPAVFNDWSMGFHRLTGRDAESQGAFAITKAALDRKLNPAQGLEVMTLLQTFYKVQTSVDLSKAG